MARNIEPKFETFSQETGLTRDGVAQTSNSAITDPRRGFINKASVNMPARDLGVTNQPITGDTLATPTTDFQTDEGTDIGDVTDITAQHEAETPELEGTQAEAQDVSDRIREINEGLIGKTDFETEQEEEFGVLDLESEKGKISDKIKAFNRQAQVLGVSKSGLLEQERGAIIGKGVTKAGLRSRVTPKTRAVEQQLRENAFNVITLAAEHDVLSGDLVDANNKVDRAIKEKYGALLEEKDILLDNFDLIRESEQFSEEEKDRAEDRAKEVAKDKKEIEDKAEEEKAIRVIGLEVLANTNDKGINDLINQAETVEEATAIAGKLLDGSGWKTINPADIATMEARGFETFTTGGRAFARKPEVEEQKFQFIKGTADQPGGVFNPATGKFEPSVTPEQQVQPSGQIVTTTFNDRDLNIDSIATPSLNAINSQAASLGGLVIGGVETSTFRTAEQQKALFDAGKTPIDGTNQISTHQRGLAIDLFPDQAYITEMKPIMEANGWQQTAGTGDLGHFEFVGTDVTGNIENLNATQRSQAAVLAKQLYGTIRTKDQIEQFLNPILQRVANGENIDAIADSLRFAGQSVEFTGAIRDAAQQITADWTDRRTQTSFDKLDDLISNNNISGVQDFLKKLALDDSGVEQAKQIIGQDRTVEFLDEIADDLKTYEDGGGDTNIFTGTLEEIARKAGTVKNAEMRKIAVKITKARQQYRRTMTGVSFSPGENLEYDAVFPSISKTAEFNTATISGLQEAFRGDVDFFYRHKMGNDAYDSIFKNEVSQDETPQQAQTINIQGQDLSVGTVIENEQGQRGRIEADGSITIIQ